ncbi:MAG: hypothetical protein AAGA75_23695 [Cyanobacteria bacterium P01_E01_bin.6]
MDSAIAGLIGAFIGAFFGLLGSLLTNWLTLKKEREQWSKDKEVEQAKWLRDKLQEIYSNCIDYLSKVSRGSEISSDGTPYLKQEHVRETFSDFSEAQKWLGILLIYHPDRQSNHYENLYQAITDFSSNPMSHLSGKHHQLRETIIELVATDTRIHGRLTR